MAKDKNDILIRSGSIEEREYCKKYNIELHKLDNGVVIVGMSCGMDYTNWARIYWEFSEGAYGNPSGTVHFLEHFFNKKIRLLAERNSLKLLAQTNKLEVRETVSGIANTNVDDYGIWVVLNGIRETLEAPLKNLDNPDRDIDIEKNIIKSEIQGRSTNHNYHVDNNFCKTIYDSKNPFFDISTTAGSKEDIDKINITHLIKIQKKVLVPKNLIISVYTEGDPAILKNLIFKLKNQYSNFPREDSPKNIINNELLEMTNPKLKTERNYMFDTKIKNGIITNQFNWIFKHKFGSKKYFSLNYLKNILSTELLNYSRKNGWGYFTEVGIARPTDDVAILNLRVDIKKDNNKNYNSGIIEILNSIKEITKNAVELEQKRQLATPLSVQDRFSWVTGGLKRYGKISNADVLRSGMLKVDSNDLDSMIDNILSTLPVTIVTGDLS